MDGASSLREMVRSMERLNGCGVGKGMWGSRWKNYIHIEFPPTLRNNF